MSYSPGRGAVAQWRPIFRFTRATCWLHNTLVRLWFTQTLCSSVLIGQYLLDKKRVDWSVFSCRENTDQSNTDISDLFGKEVVDSKVASLKNMVGEKWRREGRGSKRVHNYSIYGLWKCTRRNSRWTIISTTWCPQLEPKERVLHGIVIKVCVLQTGQGILFCTFISI